MAQMLKSMLICLAFCVCLSQALATDMTYPADFAAGTSLNAAIHSAGLQAGDTVTVTGYPTGADHLTGLMLDNGVNVKSSGGPFTIRAAADADMNFWFSLVYSNSGATLDGFVIEFDFTGLVTNYPYSIGLYADGNATFKNCTIRAINHSLSHIIEIGGANPAAIIKFENCTIEQQNAPNGWMVFIGAGYHPVFNNCTIKGSGTSVSGYFSGYSVYLQNASADFNQCQFINDAPTYAMIGSEGGSANLNGCEFTNPTLQKLFYSIAIGPYGTNVPVVNAKRCKFHAADGDVYGGGTGADAGVRLLSLDHTGSAANFENCSIWYDSGGTGNPDGAILAVSGDLGFQHCTVVNLTPAWNGRFIDSYAYGPVHITFNNNIFEGPSVDGDLGIVYQMVNAPIYDSANNIRNMGPALAGWAGARNEGNAGFTNVDPKLQADKIHLAIDSPAIKAGLNSSVNVDIDGNLRPSPAGTLPDIGCAEELTVPVELSTFSAE